MELGLTISQRDKWFEVPDDEADLTAIQEEKGQYYENLVSCNIQMVGQWSLLYKPCSDRREEKRRHTQSMKWFPFALLTNWEVTTVQKQRLSDC